MAISTFTPGGNETDANGTTHVTAVASPAASTQRLVSSVKLHNVDTAAVDASIIVNKGGTRRTLARNAALAVNATLELRDVVLDATDESIEVVLGGAPTTTNPTVQSAFVDKA